MTHRTTDAFDDYIRSKGRKPYDNNGRIKGQGRPSELAQAMRVLGNLPANVVVKNEYNGRVTYSFVGSVDARLAFERRDGQPVTPDELAKIRNHGLGLFSDTHKSRSWTSADDAIAAASELGLSVKVSQ